MKALSVRLAAVCVCSFLVAYAFLALSSGHAAMTAPGSIASSGQIVSTTISPASGLVYMLDKGNDSVIIADIHTQATTAVIPINSTLGASADLTYSEPQNLLTASTDGGGIFALDPATSTAGLLAMNTSASFGGLTADDHAPSITAYVHDASANTIHPVTSAGSVSAGVMAGPGIGAMKSMQDQSRAGAPSAAPIYGVQKGSSIVWMYDRDTLMSYDATSMAGDPTGGVYVGDDTFFVTLNSGGVGELHQVSVDPAGFGFISPATKIYTESAMDVAYSSGFVAVALGSTSPVGMKINVFDVGNGIEEVGTLDGGATYPYSALDIYFEEDRFTYDDLQYVVAGTSSGAETGSVGGSGSGAFADADGVTVLGDGWGGETGGAHVNHSPHVCSVCPPNNETQVDGVTTDDHTNDRVEFSTGEEVHLRHLFSVPGIGMDLDMMLTYRSQRDHDYRYGRGWYLNHDSRMKTETNGDESYRSGYGHHETYTKVGFNYIAPHNYDTTLAVTGGPRAITDRFGTTTNYNAAGYRTSVVDRYNNTITYTWTRDQLTSILDTRNKTYTLSYDGYGRLSSIVDYGGRTWSMAYDYRGRLITITTPTTAQQVNGRVHRYSYSRNNTVAKLADNLVHVWSPKGDVVQTLTYDINDWVTAEEIGPGAWEISYDLAQAQTTATNLSGNTTTWTFDSGGHVLSKDESTKGLRIGEPTSYTTSYEIGVTSELVEAVVYPRGNRLELQYDAVFNLLQTTRKLANTTTSSGTDLVVTHEYAGVYSQRTKTTDARGNETNYTVDGFGNTTQINRETVAQPMSQTVVETFLYDANGRVLLATDGAGRQTSFVYYASGAKIGWLQKIVRDPTGLALTTAFDYDQWGRVTSMSDPLGNTTTLTVDEEGLVTQIQSPSPFNYKTKYTYDENGALTKKELENKDRKGVLSSGTPWITTTFEYNALGWRTSKTAQLTSSVDAVTAYEYQDAGLPYKITSPEGEITEILYDERDLLFKVTRGHGASAATAVQIDYDNNGNRSEITDGRGNASTYVSDLFDRVEKITNARGHYVERDYDKSSNVTAVRAYSASAVMMAARTNSFDELDRLWKVERDRFGPGLSSTPTTVIKRDAGHRVFEVTDPLGRKATRTYDATGRVLTVADAASNSAAYTYDAASNVTIVDRTETPATGSAETFRTEYDYDELNRREGRREIDRLNASNILTTTFEYDSRGNLTFRTDAEGNPVRWGYDLANRMTEYERALAFTTIDVFTDSIFETMTYDKVDRLVTVTDDNFSDTAYEYDVLGRTTKTTFEDTKFVTRTFDKNGNVLTWLDQNGTSVSNTYNSINLLTARAITRGSGVLGATSESYSHDALNRLTFASDDDYQFSRIFDSVGNLVSEDQGYTASGSEKWRTVSTAWDDAGNSTNVTYPSGRSFGHARDNVDRLLAIVDTSTSTAVATFSWQGQGRKAVATHQNGVTSEYAYDGFARTSAIEHFTLGVQTFHKFDYAYDKVHNRRMEKNSYTTAWVNALPAAIKGFLTNRNGKGDVYAYDKAYRMVDARYDVTNPATEVATAGSQTYATLIGYTLDGLGNRSQVQSTAWGGSPATATYASDVVNQYTTLGGVSRTHDNNGNLTDDGTNLYVYDYKNRLLEVKLKSTSATIAEYKYDAAGRRVEKDVGGTVTRYILDGVSVVEEFDGSDVWQARYVQDDRIDHPVAMDRADIADVDGDGNTTEVLRFHYAQNAQGSVSEMTDAAGTVVEWVTYDAYGAAAIKDQNGGSIASSAVGNPFLYTGRAWDVESGMYFYRARTYDPTAGRFLQRDPLGYVDGLNTYEYSRSNPLSGTDPLGTKTWKETEKEVGEIVKSHQDAMQDVADDLKDAQEALAKLKADIPGRMRDGFFAGFLAGCGAGAKRYGWSPWAILASAFVGGLVVATGVAIASAKELEEAQEAVDNAEAAYKEVAEKEVAEALAEVDEAVDEYNEEHDAHATVDVVVTDQAEQTQTPVTTGDGVEHEAPPPGPAQPFGIGGGR